MFLSRLFGRGMRTRDIDGDRDREIRAEIVRDKVDGLLRETKQQLDEFLPEGWNNAQHRPQ